MSDEPITEASAPQAPVLRVVTPDATPEEIAAIVAVLSALGGTAAPAKKPVPRWAAPGARMRTSLPHGRGGWRASALPR